jgi:hypothetical protein
MWAKCLRVLRGIDKPRLVHYGSYETRFLRRMKARYDNCSPHSEFVDHLALYAVNLLSFTYAQVDFPTYSNPLKDIGRFLGFNWSNSNASGLNALLLRMEWERSRDPRTKQKLITYNAEDCEAVERVSEAIVRVCAEQEADSAAALSVHVDALARAYPRSFGPARFAVPAFEQINGAAYWDYQRSKVYIRSNDRMRRISQTGPNRLAKPAKINKAVQVKEARPARCARCCENAIYKNGRQTHTVYDLHSTLAV